MITVSAECASVLASPAFVYRVNVESWLGGTLLAASIPVSAGGEETDRSVNVPERITLTVPRVSDGFDWTPASATHPLAAKGQRLHVKLGVGLSQRRTEWFARGRFLIEDSEPDGDSVQVAAGGLLELVNEAHLISPYQPSGTFVSTVRGLVEPALTVLVDGSLTDRSVPGSINFDEDRLSGLNTVLDAWPAAGYVDPEGYLRLAAPSQSTTPVLSLVDGAGRTVIDAGGGSSRQGGANVVVARGTAADGSQLQGSAYITTGASAYGGPYNPLPVPYFFQSPLLTTADQCNAAANTIAARRQRLQNAEYRVSMVPNPTVQAGDVVALTSARLGLAATPCTVERLTLPYVAGDGQMPAMELTVRTIA